MVRFKLEDIFPDPEQLGTEQLNNLHVFVLKFSFRNIIIAVFLFHFQLPDHYEHHSRVT